MSYNGHVELDAIGLPTVCAGCKKTGLPLLVCDDCHPDGSPVEGSDWNRRR